MPLVAAVNRHESDVNKSLTLLEWTRVFWHNSRHLKRRMVSLTVPLLLKHHNRHAKFIFLRHNYLFLYQAFSKAKVTSFHRKRWQWNLCSSLNGEKELIYTQTTCLHNYTYKSGTDHRKHFSQAEFVCAMYIRLMARAPCLYTYTASVSLRIKLHTRNYGSAAV
jgi:hypothetical protein